MVQEINSNELAKAIPYGLTSKGRVNPSTLAWRIVTVIEGRAIDWSTSFSDEDNELLLKPYHDVGITISYVKC